MRKGCDGENGKWRENQQSSGGGTHIPPAPLPKKSKWLPRVSTVVIGYSKQHLQNRVLDMNTPSMRNIEVHIKSKMATKGPKMANRI